MLGTFARPRPAGARLRFYQWRLTPAEIARELEIGGFAVVETRPIHKKQGVLRALHHEFDAQFRGSPRDDGGGS